MHACRKYVAVYLMLVLGGNASPSVTDIHESCRYCQRGCRHSAALDLFGRPGVESAVIGYVTFRVRYINSYLCLPLQDLEALLTMGTKRLVNWARSQPSKCGVGAWPVPPVYPSDARKKRRVLGGPSSSEESPVRCV